MIKKTEAVFCKSFLKNGKPKTIHHLSSKKFSLRAFFIRKSALVHWYFISLCKNSPIVCLTKIFSALLTCLFALLQRELESPEWVSAEGSAVFTLLDNFVCAPLADVNRASLLWMEHASPAHWITRNHLSHSICDSSKCRGDTPCGHTDSVWQGITGLAAGALCISTADQNRDGNDFQEVELRR